MYEKGDKSIMPKMVALNMDGRIPAAQNRQIWQICQCLLLFVTNPYHSTT